MGFEPTTYTSVEAALPTELQSKRFDCGNYLIFSNVFEPLAKVVVGIKPFHLRTL